MAKRRSLVSVADPVRGSIKRRAGMAVNRDAVVMFDKVAEDILHGHRDIFDSLSPVEQDTVLRWFQDALVDDDGAKALHDALWEIDYKYKPVGIEQFLHDDYYLGRVASNLHPAWKEDLYEIFRPGSPVFEWLLTGAIGVGKTTLASIGMVRKMYEMSCLRNPPAYYGLLPESLIVFGVYSITKRQVGDTGYFMMKGFLDSSPYFRSEFPRSMKIDSKVDFSPTTGQKIQVVPGSQELHALGLDLFAFLMDEVNFMRVKDNKEAGIQTGQAYQLYNATYTRLQSRFIRPGGTLPGMMFLLSSRNAQTSFLEEHLRKVKNKPSTYVSDYKLWEVKPASRFRKKWFQVEVGDRTAQSRILNPGEEPRRGAQIVEVPGEFRDPFTEDIDQALRDIAGIATFNLSPLIRDRESIFSSFNEDMTHPFSRETLIVSIDDDVMLEDYFRIDEVCHVTRSKWKPRLNPNHPRFIHVDIGLTGDALGLAMGHVAGLTRNKRPNPDGTKSEVINPFIVIDLMARVKGPPGSEVDLSKVRSFILYLSDLFQIAKVTFDGFQSADSVQILKKQDFNAGLLSVDRTDVPYLSLRSAHFDRRLLMYHYQPYEDEVLDLQREINVKTPSKSTIDHPMKATKGGKGSKDVTDAVAGVIHLCMTEDSAQAIPDLPEFDTVAAAPRSNGKAQEVVKTTSQAKKQARKKGDERWGKFRELAK